MSDIAERLRTSIKGRSCFCHLECETADDPDPKCQRCEDLMLVEALERERDELDASAKECSDCGAYYPNHQPDCDEWVKRDMLDWDVCEVERLRNKNAELRAALEKARGDIGTLLMSCQDGPLLRQPSRGCVAIAKRCHAGIGALLQGEEEKA